MELVGLLLPILIDYIARKVADSDKRLWLSVLICAIVGAGINYVETQFVFPNPQAAFDSLTASVMTVFGLAQLSFQAVWSKTDTHNDLRNDANKNG